MLSQVVKYGMRILLIILISSSVYAAIDVYQFDSEIKEKEFRELTQQLRCPKCQNNSIADSNAVISMDMRAKVYELMQQDYSQQQIVDYMVERYGNFVTYDPPVNPVTIILWLAPLLFIVTGIGVLIMLSRRRPQTQTETEYQLSTEEQQRLTAILSENDSLNQSRGAHK